MTRGLVRERATLAGFTALILIVLVGFSLLYNSISSLRSDVANLNRSLEEQSRVISELQRQVLSQGETLRDLEGLKARISRIEESLKGVATTGDLDRVARELGVLSAELKLLSSRLSNVNETLRSNIMELSTRLEALSRRVSDLAESMLFPVIVTDGVGDKVVISKRPSRIVSLAPSVTETLYYVGAINLLVGVDEWSDFPSIVKERRDRGELAVVGYWSPKVEVIVGLKPDLVIGVASVPSHRALKSILSPYGIPVVLLPDFRLSDIIDSILIVGKVTGRLVEAYEMIHRFEVAVRYATLLASKVELKPRIAAIVWVKPLFVVGGGTWEHDMLEVVGLNVYGNLSLWPQVSPESLLERAPDVIIATSSHGMVKVEDIVNTLVSSLGDAAYSIPALRDGRIYVLSGSYEDSFVRPSPRTVLALYVLLIIIHPQLFNLSPAEIPQVVEPSTLNVTKVLEGIAPEPVLEVLKASLGG